MEELPLLTRFIANNFQRSAPPTSSQSTSSIDHRIHVVVQERFCHYRPYRSICLCFAKHTWKEYALRHVEASMWHIKAQDNEQETMENVRSIEWQRGFYLRRRTICSFSVLSALSAFRSVERVRTNDDVTQFNCKIYAYKIL